MSLEETTSPLGALRRGLRALRSRTRRPSSGIAWRAHRLGLELYPAPLAAGVAIGTLSAIGALTGGLRPDPYAPPGFLDGIRYPIERSAMLRTPIVTGAIRDMHVVERTGVVWAVGEGGLVLTSADGGESWAARSVQTGAPSLLGLDGDGRGDRADALRARIRDARQRGAELLERARQRAKQSGLSVELVEAVVRGQVPLAELERAQRPASGRGAAKLPTVDGGPIEEEKTPRVDAEPLEQVAGLRDAYRALEGRWTDQEQMVRTLSSRAERERDFARELLEADHATRTLRAIAFAPDGVVGFAVGEHGVVARTRDSGASWEWVAVGPPEVELTEVAIGSGGAVAALVGGAPRAWLSRDAGESWRPSLSPPSGASALEPGAGLWFTESGQLSIRLRGGARLDADGEALRPSAPGGEGRIAIHAMRAAPGGVRELLVGRELRLLRHDSGARELLRQEVSLDPEGERPGRAWLSDREPLAFGVLGARVYRWSRDAGLERVDPPSGDSGRSFTSVAFGARGRRGFVADDGGRLWRTRDGGERWELRAIGAREVLQRLEAGHPGTDWSVEQGQLWRERDGERAAVTGAYALYPAPLWCAGWVLAWVLMLVGVGRAPRVVAEASVGNQLGSDRPLERGDPDPLHFGELARGLCGFVRNARTEPPLTFAITGEWGSGKSSLMNLLRAELREHGYRPVWFNAWHHQTEEHLLASLLTAIRREAIPPLWHPAAWVFRARLFFRRARRRPVRLGLAALLVAIGASELGLLEPWLSWARLPGFPGLGDLGVVAAGCAGLLNLARSGLGVSLAGDLAYAVRGSWSTSALSTRQGFRQRFADEFRDVTEALKPTALVLLIDDLDRCRPERIMNTLECVNFLVSSGDCFVVLGLARKQVESAIAHELGALAEVPEGASKPTPLTRRSYARSYLEKLINIEVPVPPVGERGEALWRPGRAAAPGARSRLVPRMALAASIALALAGGAVVRVLDDGTSRDSGAPPASSRAIADPVRAAQGEGAEAAEGPSEDRGANRAPAPPLAEASGPDPDAAPSVAERAQLLAHPGADPRGPLLWAAGLALGLFIWILFAQLLRERALVVHDSDAFTGALRVWGKLIARLAVTPRAIKRHYNRLRFMAMRLRFDRDAGAEGLGAPALVALSVVQSLRSGGEGAALADLDLESAADADSELGRAIADACEQHRAAFGTLPSAEARARYLELFRAVRLS